MELGERRTETGGGLTAPAALNRPLARLRAEHHPQGPAPAITIQTDPPPPSLELQLDRFFGHQLIDQLTVLIDQIPQTIPQAEGFGLTELSGPTVTANQHRKRVTAGIPSQPPPFSFTLNHGHDGHGS